MDITPEMISHVYHAISAEEFKSQNKGTLGKDGKPMRGAHTVFSKLNDELREKFCAKDATAEYRKMFPVALLKDMAAKGYIVMHPVYGGAKVYHPSNAPAKAVSITADSIAKKYQNVTNKYALPAGLTPPPVIAPPASGTARQARR